VHLNAYRPVEDITATSRPDGLRGTSYDGACGSLEKPCVRRRSRGGDALAP
jgi:hypothetical protein